MLEHEGEEGDALGDAVDVAFRVGNLRSHSVEHEREAEAGTCDPDDGGDDAAVEHGISCDAGMLSLPLSIGLGGVHFCHVAAAVVVAVVVVVVVAEYLRRVRGMNECGRGGDNAKASWT